MAEKLISPGVFTNERDLTYLPQGIAQISGVFIGPTERGPAFEPVLVESPNEYRSIFGDGGYYTDYAVLNYLSDAGSAYVVRILGDEEYEGETIEFRYNSEFGDAHPDIAEDFLMAVLAPTQNAGGDITDARVTTDDLGDDKLNTVSEFNLTLEIDGDREVNYIVSFDPSAKNYIANIFGTSPTGIREAYVLLNFKELHEQIMEYEYYDHDESSATGDIVRGQEVLVEVPQGENKLDFTGNAKGYSSAETPWIQSQDLLPDQPGREVYDLFKFVTLSHGNSANKTVKVGIDRVRFAGDVPGSEYGSFSVVVRDFGDSDRRPEVLEQFDNVNLDPSSPQFIARVIGDRYAEYTDEGKIRFHGDYNNNSTYIRVVMNNDVVDANARGRNDLSQLVPWGFGSYEFPAEFATVPQHGLITVTSQSERPERWGLFPNVTPPYDPSGESDLPEPPFNGRIYHGFDFGSSSNLNFLAPVGAKDYEEELGDAVNALSTDFSLDDCYFDAFGEYRVMEPATETTPEVRSGTRFTERKFILGFQGGFDGKDPSTPVLKGENIVAGNSQGYDLSSYDAPGTQAYYKAFGLMSNTDEYDVNLLATPGVIQSLHPSVVRRGIELCEDRADCFYVFDSVPVNANPAQAVQAVQTLDSNYAATYYPWVRVLDYATNQYVRVPPSALMPRVYAFNDKVAAEWYAPAGLNRGGIPEAVEAVTRLTKDERDELYAGRVNPIAQFPREGVVAWGQKTLQSQPSALDRVNVRRLLIAVKKFIASASRYLVFEQNTARTRLRFLNIVNPYLEQVQQRAGVYAFKVKCDEENNTPDIIDRNILYAEMYLQPARSSEFIVLDFNVLPTGATFPE